MSGKGILAGLATAAALCLFSVKAVASEEQDAVTELLSIQVENDWPPESELGTRILEEESEASEESDGILVKQTTLLGGTATVAWLRRPDGSAELTFGKNNGINTVQFFTPYVDVNKAYGVPNYLVEFYSEEEKEKEGLWDQIDMGGGDYADFNGGIDVTRELVASGYLQEEITKLLDRFPEIHPHERTYTLRLVNAGATFRQEDQTGWWDVDYVLSAKADNGEELRLVYVDIHRLMGDWHDTNCTMDVSEKSLWKLLEDPAENKGRIWLQHIRGDSFRDEASVRRFVSEQGAETVLPDGVESDIAWDYSRQELFYYDWILCQGETADYTVVLAVPLMEKQEEGYYLAGRIGREVKDKTEYQNLLSSIMQTLRGIPYLHVVKKGECLSEIAEKYCGGQAAYPQIRLYDEAAGGAMPFADPNLIYPGQKVMLPTVIEYDARRDAATVHP